jgi:hypothetical protein
MRGPPECAVPVVPECAVPVLRETGTVLHSSVLRETGTVLHSCILAIALTGTVLHHLRD